MVEETIQITNEHLKFCFDSLYSYLNKKKLPKFPSSLPDKKSPLFVTWLKSSEKNLRGCIGTFYSDYLSINLKKFIYISAFEDDRFGAIREEEFLDLHLSLSFLYNFKNIDKWDDWEIGVHGVYLQFWDLEDKCKRSATYLPEVMVINNWDKFETFRHCMKKSGYKGDFNDFLEIDIQVMTYKSTKGYMSYQEYLKLK